MTTVKRAAPLLADRLTLYASDSELRAAIFGARATSGTIETVWASYIRDPSFPRLSSIMGGRHVPSVLAWFDNLESRAIPAAGEPISDEEALALWNTKRGKRRASNEGRGRVVR
jgi:hypothetical protein